MSRPGFIDGGWAVVDHGNYYPPRVIERAKTIREACWAFYIFSAHELKNGRSPDYRITPPVDMLPWRELGLPSWAVKELTQAEQRAKVETATDTTLKSSLRSMIK